LYWENKPVLKIDLAVKPSILIVALELTSINIDFIPVLKLKKVGFFNAVLILVCGISARDAGKQFFAELCTCSLKPLGETMKTRAGIAGSRQDQTRDSAAVFHRRGQNPKQLPKCSKVQHAHKHHFLHRVLLPHVKDGADTGRVQWCPEHIGKLAYKSKDCNTDIPVFRFQPFRSVRAAAKHMSDCAYHLAIKFAHVWRKKRDACGRGIKKTIINQLAPQCSARIVLKARKVQLLAPARHSADEK
jgi:hypothetical protein